MDNKILESYIDTVNEMIADEDKIVTYKLLSRKLGLHVNTAKQLLYLYLTKQKSENKYPVSATYFLAGKLVDGTFNVNVVNDTKLKSAQSEFVNYTSEHIYSVQNTKNVKDINMLGGVKKEVQDVGSTRLVIKCSKSLIKIRGNNRLGAEICAQYKQNDSMQEKKTKEGKFDEENKKDDEIKEAINNKQETKKIKNVMVKCHEKDNVENDQRLSKTRNIGDFFSNAAKILKNQKNSSKTKQEVIIVEEEVQKRPKESTKKRMKGNKRKRIQMYSDSEESDDDNDEESPPLEEVEECPQTAAFEKKKAEEINKSAANNKWKKRKVVDKIVMNEDGYLETRKEIIFETDSENEANDKTPPSKEVSKPKPGSDREKGSQNVPNTKKQASLLNFFKKN